MFISTIPGQLREQPDLERDFQEYIFAFRSDPRERSSTGM